MAIYVQIIFATILEYVFFHSTPPPLSILGASIIISAAIYVALSKKVHLTDGAKKVAADVNLLEENLQSSEEQIVGDEETALLGPKLGP